MTTFYLIRHAERTGPADLLAGRLPGFLLSDNGRSQSQRLAGRFASESVHRIFCSPLERSVATAQPLQGTTLAEVETSEDIHEVNFGAWSGRTFGELASDEEWRRFNRVRGIARAPGGETMAEVQMRMVRAMLRWREQFPKAGIAIVSHADPIKVAVAFFAGIPLELFDRIEIGLASVSVIKVDHGGAGVVRLNGTVGTEE